MIQTNSIDARSSEMNAARRGSLMAAAGLMLLSLWGAQSAMAGQWHAATIGTQIPHRMYPVSAIPWASSFHVYSIAEAPLTLYQSEYSNGAWNYVPIYTDAFAGPVTASGIFYQTEQVFHIDSDLHLRLTYFNLLKGWKTIGVDGSGENTWNNFDAYISTVVFNNKLYIFYADNMPSPAKNALRYAVFDGTTFTYHVLDGNGGAGGRMNSSMAQPSAVVGPNGLRVYYRDQDRRMLREAYSADGSNWTSFADLDGTAYYGGMVGDVGSHPAATVVNGKVSVFYRDNTNGVLRLAQLNGNWHFGSIDPIDAGTAAAPIVHGGALFGFYAQNGLLRATWGSGPGAMNTQTIDGAGGVANGSTSDYIFGPVVALEYNSAPTVFYQDGTTGRMRNAYWQ